MHLPPKTLQTIVSLQELGVESVLYGSQGVSLYIGAFKRFGDIDLLVEDRWIKNGWGKLVATMSRLGFALQDEHEREFIDFKGTLVAFASIDILVRDGIVQSVNDATQEFKINGKTVRTLKPEIFLKVYEFSEKDGYRKDVRGKKDREVIGLIDRYLWTKAQDRQAEPN